MSSVTKAEVISFIESEFPDIAKSVKEEKYDTLKIKEKTALGAAFKEKGWIKTKASKDAITFLRTLMGAKEIDTYERNITSEPSLTKKNAEPPKMRTKKDKEPSSSKTTQDASTIKFEVVGYNIVSGLNKFDVEEQTITDFPKIKKSVSDAYKALITHYTGNNSTYMDYISHYSEYVKKVEEFCNKTKNIVIHKQVFTSTKNEIKYKVIDDKKNSAVKLNDTNMITIIRDNERYNKDLASRITKYKKFTEEESKALMDTDLIYTVDAFNYKWITTEQYMRGSMVLDGMCKEKLHTTIGIVGDISEDNLDKTLRNIETSKRDEKQYPVLYYSLISSIRGINRTNIMKHCLDIFNNRSAICSHNKLTQDMKKSMWLAALNNLEQMDSRDETQTMWYRILQSKCMYQIFMNAVPEAAWMTKGLASLIKSRRTLEMAISELYPISFLFTPFMLGIDTSRAKSSDMKTFKTYYDMMISFEHYDEMEYSKLSWLYYPLKWNGRRSHGEIIYNDTVAILKDIIDSAASPKPKPKAKANAKTPDLYDDREDNDDDDDVEIDEDDDDDDDE